MLNCLRFVKFLCVRSCNVVVKNESSMALGFYTLSPLKQFFDSRRFEQLAQFSNSYPRSVRCYFMWSSKNSYAYNNKSYTVTVTIAVYVLVFYVVPIHTRKVR